MIGKVCTVCNGRSLAGDNCVTCMVTGFGRIGFALGIFRREILDSGFGDFFRVVTCIPIVISILVLLDVIEVEIKRVI